MASSLAKAGIVTTASLPATWRAKRLACPSGLTSSGSPSTVYVVRSVDDTCHVTRRGIRVDNTAISFKSNLSDPSWSKRASQELNFCQNCQSRTSAGCRPDLSIRAISSNDFRVGVNIEIDNAPWRVIEFLHVKPGKGAAFVRTKLKNYITGNTVEKTFRAGESVDEASVQKDVKQFTYRDGDLLVFMDMSTYEETKISKEEIGPRARWLKEGMECSVLTWNDRVIDVELPITVSVKVAETDPGIRGDTASGGTKPAKVDTGATVNVPFFVNVGDEILVDTRTSTYMSRA